MSSRTTDASGRSQRVSSVTHSVQHSLSVSPGPPTSSDFNADSNDEYAACRDLGIRYQCDHHLGQVWTDTVNSQLTLWAKYYETWCRLSRDRVRPHVGTAYLHIQDAHKWISFVQKSVHYQWTDVRAHVVTLRKWVIAVNAILHAVAPSSPPSSPPRSPPDEPATSTQRHLVGTSGYGTDTAG